jgi:hypothetical protein
MDRASRDISGFGQCEEAIAGVELSVEGIRAVARRQLAGSIVVALLIAGVAGLSATRPSRDLAAAPSRQIFPVVRQPTFSTPLEHNLAAVKRTKEIP